MSTLQLIPATGNPIDVRPDQMKVVVGRSVASDIVLDDASISRRHLSIEQRENGFFVTDLGSANGSFLDGARFKEELQLRDGAELRLGSVKVKVRIVAEEGDSEATIMVDIDEVTGEMPAVPRRPGADEEATASMPSVPASSELEDLVRSPPPPISSPPPPRAAPRETAELIDETMAETAEEVRASLPSKPAAAPPAPAGSSRRAAPGSAPVPQMSAPPPDKKGRHPAIWVAAGCGGCLLAVILFAAVIGGGLYYLTQGAAQGVEEHLAALRSGDRDAAYGMLSESYQARLAREDFEQMLTEHPSLGSNQSSSFSNRSVDNDTARLSGTLTSQSGGVEPVVFELVKERGAWRISDIHFGPS